MPSEWTSLEEHEIAIAHLSDFHFGSPNCDEPWKLIEQFLQDKVRPELVLVTGDLVDTPDVKLFEKAKECLDRLKIRYFVCIGNHDRFRRGNKLRIGKQLSRWLRIIPSVAIIGFIITAQIHIPTWHWWWLTVSIPLIWLSTWAFEKLWSSEDVSAQFHRVFQGKIASPNRPEPLTVGHGPSQWTVGILGADSCQHADASARGYVPESIFLPITQQTVEQEWDLCIFLIHHHLLPIRNLEASRRDNRADLLNLTCLVNAGSLLETLASAHVDLVLHGHEHEHNWAGYSSFDAGYVQVKVIGAGSATGNATLKGCDVNRATFNTLILSPSRAVRIRRLAFRASTWRVEDEINILTSSDVRRSRIRRAMPRRRFIKGEIVKHVEFTRDRDIWVNLYLSSWSVDDSGAFEWEIYNSTGTPEIKRINLREQGSNHCVPILDHSFRQAGDYRQLLTFAIPNESRKKQISLEICYCWRGGGALTQSEVQRIKKSPAPGLFRDQLLEFATIWTPSPVASAELFLLLPQEYAPADIRVAVRQRGLELPHEASELQANLRTLAPGSYAFRVPFPQIGRDYALAWSPVAVEGNPATRDETTVSGNEFGAFCLAVREYGEELLRHFYAHFAKGTFGDGISASIYLKDEEDPFSAVCVAQTFHGDGPGHVPPKKMTLLSNRPAFTRAWWGWPVILLKDEKNDSGEVEFINGEQAVICLPLRFGFKWTNPPPWGIVRLGILKNADKITPENTEQLWTILSVAALSMLAEAISMATGIDQQ